MLKYKGGNLMIAGSEQFKTAMSAVRERIADAKRCGTRRGFIDYYGCMSVCVELISILEEAGKAAEGGDCVYAYSVASLILVHCAKLAGSADDSAGGISDTLGYVKEVLEKVCSGVERGSDQAEFIFLHSLKDSQNKAFVDWDDFAYDLLLPCARLAAAKNVDKLYAVLDAFHARLSVKEYSSWHLENDRLVRLAAITAVDGEQAAEKFIFANLKYDGIRRIAIRSSIDKGNYALAEKLCREKIQAAGSDYHWTREWYTMLFEIYTKTDDQEKQSNLAEELLVYKYDTQYYDILKKLLTEKGTWNTAYPPLLMQLSQSLPYHLYMSILSKENETLKLLDELKMHPTEVYHYGEQLSKDFPSEISVLCLGQIRKQAAESNNRIAYKKVCANIKKLFEFGGISEADSIIVELKAKYPRRPAMIEELDKIAGRLAKKRK
jgi:hypothetical protein